MKRIQWIRAGDVLIIGVCVLLIVVLSLTVIGGETGSIVSVGTPYGDYRLALYENTTQVFEGADGLTVTVCVQDGEAFVSQADCDDALCVAAGKLHRAGQHAVCLPAGIVVSVEGGASAPDAIAR